MMGSTTNRDSKDIMYLVKRGSVGAEIGVWEANSSAKFLERGVGELHLVDPWSVEPYRESSEHGTYENYLERYKKVTGAANEENFVTYYEQVYNRVKKRFKDNPNVHIHRMTSDAWFESFKGTLDWIYIDGDHSFEGCYRDLINAHKVVKNGGLILGDDYQWPFQVHGKEGVTKAVDRFVKEKKLKLVQEGPKSQFSIEVYHAPVF